jgi:addiction module HigA family antidote
MAMWSGWTWNNIIEERIVAEYRMTRRPQREPTHPGAILREDVLPALGLSVSAAARMIGVTRQTLHRILSERGPITPEMALRIGKFCGNGPELWLNLQSAHDLWHAERAMAGALKKIPTPKVAA